MPRSWYEVVFWKYIRNKHKNPETKYTNKLKKLGTYKMKVKTYFQYSTHLRHYCHDYFIFIIITQQWFSPYKTTLLSWFFRKEHLYPGKLNDLFKYLDLLPPVIRNPSVSHFQSATKNSCFNSFITGFKVKKKVLIWNIDKKMMWCLGFTL